MAFWHPFYLIQAADGAKASVGAPDAGLSTVLKNPIFILIGGLIAAGAIVVMRRKFARR